MAIASLSFAAFVAAVLPVYYLLPRRAQNYWLLLVSYFFYASWAWQFPCILLLLTLVNLGVGRRLQGGSAWRRGLFWGGVAFDVLALLWLRWRPPASTGAVVGLSFYVLQAIAYLADVRSGVLRAVPDPVDFALYLAYFPRLLAGPIEQPRSFLRQLAEPRVVDDARLARSFTLIVIGVFRKIVLADPLAAMIPAGVFRTPAHFAPAVLISSVLVFVFSLYNDFAGYTSIVRGVSGLFGIELTANFAQPFFARSFTEFWNRWHASLSRWLRDYIYLPLSRTLLRRNPSLWNVPNLLLPPMAAMLASGVWHGGGSGMLVWGGLHGSYLIAERIATLLRRPGVRREPPRWRSVVAALSVFVLGLFAAVFFLMDMPVALEFWQGVFAGSGTGTPDLRVLLLMAPSLGLDWIQYRHRDDAPFLAWPQLARAASLAFAIVLIFLMSRRAPAPFVYQGF